MEADKVSIKTVGSEKWAHGLRQKAKELAGHLDVGYMQLAKILYDLYDVPVDGNPTNGPWLRAWGFNDIGEFAEAELSIEKRKAQYLRNIYYRLEVELRDLDDILRKKIVSLGWSKVRLLVRVLTLSNAAEWEAIAAKSNYSNLEASVKLYTRSLEKAYAAQEKGDTFTVPAPELVVREKSPPALSTFADLAAQASSEFTSNIPTPTTLAANILLNPASSIPVAPLDLPKRFLSTTSPDGEVFHKRFFSVPHEMCEIVDMALERAKELSKSDSPSHNLGIVCQDYLSTNAFGKGDRDQMLRFLIKYESLLKVKIVILDADGTPMYGISHLEDLAANLQSPQ